MKVNRSKKKLQVRVTVESLGESFPHTNLRQVISWLTDRETEWISRGVTNLELRFSADWDCPSEIEIIGTREETDKEFAARMRAVEKEKRQEAVAMQNHLKFIETEAKKLGII